MAKTLSSKELNRLLQGFEDAGHRVQAIKSGYRILHSSGKGMITMHLTLSDRRGMQNLRGDAIRQGFEWPLD